MATFKNFNQITRFVCKYCGIEFSNNNHILRCPVKNHKFFLMDRNAREDYVNWIFGKVEHLSQYSLDNVRKHKRFIERLYVLVDLAIKDVGICGHLLVGFSKFEKQQIYLLSRCIEKSFVPPQISFGFPKSFKDWDN
jgi:hypothetical protein